MVVVVVVGPSSSLSPVSPSAPVDVGVVGVVPQWSRRSRRGGGSRSSSSSSSRSSSRSPEKTLRRRTFGKEAHSVFQAPQTPRRAGERSFAQLRGESLWFRCRNSWQQITFNFSEIKIPSWLRPEVAFLGFEFRTHPPPQRKRKQRNT